MAQISSWTAKLEVVVTDASAEAGRQVFSVQGGSCAMAELGDAVAKRIAAMQSLLSGQKEIEARIEKAEAEAAKAKAAQQAAEQKLALVIEANNAKPQAQPEAEEPSSPGPLLPVRPTSKRK